MRIACWCARSTNRCTRPCTGWRASTKPASQVPRRTMFMPQYDQIRTAAWRPSGAPDVAPLYAMPFPERVTGSLIDLTRATQRAGADAPRTIQIRSLNRALRALVPDVVSEDIEATAAGRTWLYALAPVRGPALLPIVRAW